jgi:hypothetical protein
MESYGTIHYKLDSQRLWYELTTVAPQPLRLELIRSRQTADFFVATVFMSAIFGATAIIIGLLENGTHLTGGAGAWTLGTIPAWRVWVGGLYFGMPATTMGLGSAHLSLGILIILFVPLFCYRMAIDMTLPWAGAIQALVNIGRIRLADELRLVIPIEHEQEMEMWRIVGGFVTARDSDRIMKWAQAFDRLGVKSHAQRASTSPPEDD